MITRGLVDAEHHTFLISAADTDPTETYSEGQVFDAGNNLISVHTGIAYGPVNVILEQLSGDDDMFLNGGPAIDLDAWDNVEEVHVVCRQPMLFITLSNEIVEEFGELTSPIGARCFRIATRGRAEHWDMDVDSATEDYLIQTSARWQPVDDPRDQSHRRCVARRTLNRRLPTTLTGTPVLKE
ncbi:hypothetical protein GCM10020255_024820 [Rhodococcus baikonurensis]